jgi:hypothetical protein
MIAVDAAAAGNSIVNVPLVTVLSPPKLIARIDRLVVNPEIAVVLYIKHPRAVKVAEVQLVSEKSQIAVSLSKVGSILVKVFPPPVYPEDVVVTS